MNQSVFFILLYGSKNYLISSYVESSLFIEKLSYSLPESEIEKSLVKYECELEASSLSFPESESLFSISSLGIIVNLYVLKPKS